tara:strand:+ start:5561 stop:6121 length:561 start_codon:yes stop_codon:yes gene_type:complete
MEYTDFLQSTLPNNHFKFISTNNDGTCCYQSVLKLLKIHNLVKKNMNTKVIQAKAVNWIIDNKQTYISLFEMPLEDYVIYNHDLDSFDEYIQNYKIYSKNNYDSWGGIPEIIALSEIYKINIHIYTGNSFDKKNNILTNGLFKSNKPKKDFRYKLLFSTSREYDVNINVLYIKDDVYGDHFIGLVP